MPSLLIRPALVALGFFAFVAGISSFIVNKWGISSDFVVSRHQNVLVLNYNNKQQAKNGLGARNRRYYRVPKKNRTVEFINSKSEEDITHNGEMYSGMWWLNKQDFLLSDFEHMTNLEGATFKAFQQQDKKKKEGNDEGGILLTRDWLDLNVEHLSSYVKHMEWTTKVTTGGEGTSNALVDGVIKILNNYIDNSQQYQYYASSDEELAVRSTIALLPFRAAPGSSLLKNVLLKLQLAATLASLWKAGIPRAVVVGVSDEERITFLEVKELLQSKLDIEKTMQLAYVHENNVTEDESKLVPKVALTGLKRVMHMKMKSKEDYYNYDEVQAWLGQDPQRWKYVYFSEPDLLLHLRASALPAITQQLEGGKLIAGHRLEPLPHARDYDKAALKNMIFENTKYTIDSFLLPNHGVFAAIQQMDAASDDDDVCCDQGKYYPSHRETLKRGLS